MTMVEFSCGLEGDHTVRCKGLGTLDITFKRTVRVPDNGKPSFLPPDVGNFPLFKVKDYATKLPAPMAAKGGLFLPMYQREAMWIDLSASQPFMIKIYCGGINVVFGECEYEDMATKLRRRKILTDGGSVQDYVVAPDQWWVDGIAASAGIVKQFVATPLGDGYTVEAQLTGNETTGGLQFEITPGGLPPVTIKHFKIFVKILSGKTIAVPLASHEDITDIKLRIEELEDIPADQQRLLLDGEQLRDGSTARDYGLREGSHVKLVLRLRGGGYAQPELGIAPGGLIRQTIVKDTSQRDIWRRELTTTFNVQILNSAVFQEVTGRDPPASPITAEIYAKTGLPFFKLYEEPSTIHGAFDNVKSIATIDKHVEKSHKHPLVRIQHGKTETADKALGSGTKKSNVVMDLDGILNPDGPLREFRTVHDLEKELRKVATASFD